MATYRKRPGPNGRSVWQARVARKGHPPQYRTFDTKTAAERWAVEIESEMKRGVFVSREAAESVTLKELLERYLREITPTHKGAAAEEPRLRALSRQPLAQRIVATLRPKDFAAWRDERLREVSAGTVARELNLLHHVFEIARREWDVYLLNPVGDVRRPKQPPGRERRLSEDEEEKLLSALRAAERDEQGRYTSAARNVWMRPLVAFAIETAMRRGELLALRWKDVDLARRTARLRDTKNGEPRTVPLSPKACEALREVPRSVDGRVFPLHPEGVKSAWERALERARRDYERECAEKGTKPDSSFLADLHFHDLRHEATSRLARVYQPHELAKITGHKDLRMLLRYYHPTPEDLAEKLSRF